MPYVVFCVDLLTGSFMFHLIYLGLTFLLIYFIYHNVLSTAEYQ